MIKVIALDLIGVLVREKNINLSGDFSKMERLFGPNKSDEEYISQIKSIFPNKDYETIVNETKEIINSLYELKVSQDSLWDLKKNYDNISLVIVTNHVSFVEDYIISNFGNDLFSDIFISANINEIKPHSSFYNNVLRKLDIKPSEMLFLDDNFNNISGANNLGINTIYISKDDNVIGKVEDFFNKSNN